MSASIDQSSSTEKRSSRSSDNSDAETIEKVVDVDSVAATTKQNDQTDAQIISALENEEAKPKRVSPEYDLPWGDLQKWALRDHLAKFTVQVPVTVEGKKTIRVYTLWRTLSKEVVELSGYPVPFLLDRYAELKSLDEITVHTSDVVLPYLDRYQFETNGGLSGMVSGVPGVADGTRIQTTPVGDVHETIPKGFVRTEDGQVVYELGQSATEPETASKKTRNDQQQYRMSEAGSAIRTVVAQSNTDGLDEALGENASLVRLGALSTAVIGAAFAAQALSHHVTVNIFWV